MQGIQGNLAYSSLFIVIHMFPGNRDLDSDTLLMNSGLAEVF